MSQEPPISAATRAAYLAAVRLDLESRRKQRADAAEQAARSLESEIRAWHLSGATDAHLQRYTTAELAARFKVATNQISAALLALGWRRKRDWRGSMPYRRWWKSPDQ